MMLAGRLWVNGEYHHHYGSITIHCTMIWTWKMQFLLFDWNKSLNALGWNSVRSWREGPKSWKMSNSSNDVNSVGFHLGHEAAPAALLSAPVSAESSVKTTCVFIVWELSIFSIIPFEFQTILLFIFKLLVYYLGVQQITKLMVWIVSRFLSHGSDHFRNNNKDKTNVTLNKIFKCVKTK